MVGISWVWFNLYCLKGTQSVITKIDNYFSLNLKGNCQKIDKEIAWHKYKCSLMPEKAGAFITIKSMHIEKSYVSIG